MTKRRLYTISLAFGIAVFIVLAYFLIGFPPKNPHTEFGMTWSAPYAQWLGIDPQKGLETALDDLGIRLVRIPIYWTVVQPNQERFDWATYDKQLDAVAAREGRAILVLGAKQPRWPEWWIPAWVSDLEPQKQEEAQLRYVEETFHHFSQHPAVKGWQVENESQLEFGIGEVQSKKFVAKEMDLVRRLEAEARPSSKRPVYTTESGELSMWLSFAGHVDGVGVSVYRVIVNRFIGIWRYRTPAIYYRRKANLVERWTGPIYVSELQMEPWAVNGILDTPIEEQGKTFDLAQMKSNLDFAERLDFNEVYFWGAEWWYWMKEKQDHPEFWDEAKEFLSNR